MTAFNALLRMAGEIAFPISVEIDLLSDRMILTTAGKHLATWRLKDITIAPTNRGYRVVAEGEEVILTLTDREQFATEIGRRLGSR